MTQETKGKESCTNAKVAPKRTSKCILVPLKTTLETRARDSFITVYVTSVPVKQASRTLEVIRRLLPGDGGVDLQHLRRFAKTRDVPDIVKDTFGEARHSAQEISTTASEDFSSRNASQLAPRHEVHASEAYGSESVAPSAQTNTTAVVDDSTASIATPADSRTKTDDTAPGDLFLIVGSTNAISFAAVTEELSAIVNNAVIFSIQVPRLAPTSQEQAALWSSQYWPTVYKKSNPFGPHPSIVSRTEQEIRGEVEKWMNLAYEVAHQADATGSGEAVGVVIIERENGVGYPVAVAGDARWVDWPCKGPGNVTAHAALRAIAMVAAGVKTFNDPEQSTNTVSTSTLHLESEKVAAEQLIKAGASSSPPSLQPDTDVTLHDGRATKADSNDIFQDKPILNAEKDHYDPSGTAAGYLCHDLEIYCTHEPCVMCSMAILHSRFGKVIFQHRLQKTGGMRADGDLGHGLFWRKELNWTLLAWQWRPSSYDEEVEQADFHA
ncbi:cytidine deaminase-like protein [Stipitochalara longipes BDJ]|nr:cytidine deaminase-like protein [Stipitochalara longipes BDJ]